MRIDFNGKTNRDEVWINVIVFTLANGEDITIDREKTEWTVCGNKLNMLWDNCYSWNGEHCGYTITPKMFDGAFIKSVEVEDDAPSDYAVEITNWKII